MKRRGDMLEGVAFGASVACLIHCTALPVLLALLPALASAAPTPTVFHMVALGLAVPATGLALWTGYRRHRQVAPLLAGLAGLALLATGVLAFGEGPLEVPVTVAGSLLIAAAHVANWQLRRRGDHRLA